MSQRVVDGLDEKGDVDAETGGNQFPAGGAWAKRRADTVTNGVFNAQLTGAE